MFWQKLLIYTFTGVISVNVFGAHIHGAHDDWSLRHPFPLAEIEQNSLQNHPAPVATATATNVGSSYARFTGA